MIMEGLLGLCVIILLSVQTDPTLSLLRYYILMLFLLFIIYLHARPITSRLKIVYPSKHQLHAGPTTAPVCYLI